MSEVIVVVVGCDDSMHFILPRYLHSRFFGQSKPLNVSKQAVHVAGQIQGIQSFLHLFCFSKNQVEAY